MKKIQLAALLAALTSCSALAENPIPPPPSDLGGLDANFALPDEKQFEGLTPPATDPRDFEGFWFRDLGSIVRPAGGGPPPGPPPHMGPDCAPSADTRNMGELWIIAPKVIVRLEQKEQNLRKIYLNAKHPRNLTPQPNGHTIGHWEGDTLVTDSVGFINADGTASDRHEIQRIKKIKSGTRWMLQEDSIVTSDGITQHEKYSTTWRPDMRLYEYICEENRDRYQLVNGELTNPNLPPDRKQ